MISTKKKNAPKPKPKQKSSEGKTEEEIAALIRVEKENGVLASSSSSVLLNTCVREVSHDHSRHTS